MDFHVFENDTALSSAAADAVCELLQEKPDALLCIAAGHSSLGLFRELIRRFQEKKVDFSRAGFSAMDEWSGMNETTPGSCGDFLVKNFLSQVNFPRERVRLVNGKATDLQAECAQIKEIIEAAGGFDLIVLGIGINGHLALNEPGVDFSLSVHTTVLDSVTRQVGKKYFESAPQLTGGVTIGIADIAAAKKAILLVNGEKKSRIVKQILDSPVTNQLPATALKDMPHAAFWCDRDAALLCEEA